VDWVEIYRRLLLIRRFEETVAVLVNANKIGGVTHEYIGQEAVAVGVCAELRNSDVITSTHRGHGHVLAKGGDPGRMYAELMARETGMNRARGGSMHIADVSIGIFGANGIVAAGAPIAAGAALASKMRADGNVAVTFFGDGGANQGVLFETLNLASLWALPLIFVCENNAYAATTRTAEVLGVKSIAKRAAAFGMPGHEINGMDVREVWKASRKAVERARSGGGPSFIEAQTYRFVGHHTAEGMMNLAYRSAEEIAEWVEEDPIARERERLLSDSVPRERLESIESEVEAAIASAVAFAEASPWPGPETALDYMYASGARAIGGLPS